MSSPAAIARLVLVLFAVCGLAVPAVAAGRRAATLRPPAAHGRPGVPVLIRDPSGTALKAFRVALRRAAKRKGQARIAVYGASHTAADLWTGELRRRLQTRFGDAGHGFAFPVRWNLGYRHQDLVVESSKGWLVGRHKKDDGTVVADLGYTGLLATSSDPADYAQVRTTTDNPHGHLANRAEVWIRTAPDGGTLLVEVDGQVELISTRGETVEPKFHTWKLAKGQHTLRVAPAGDGPVTVYGMVLELSTSGVIIDQLGIPGMRADILLRWQEDTWGSMLARRKPDLVVLAYGTNDVGDVDEPIGDYLETWRKVLTRLKKVNPSGSCLLVGPTDRLGRDEFGHKRTLPRTAAVIAAQQQVAAQFGCGHWDAVAAMGGPGAMKRWQRARLASPDDVHLTRNGYTWLAELFEFALLREPRVPRPKRAAGR